MVVAGLAFYAITLLLDMCELTGFKVRLKFSNFDWYFPTKMKNFYLQTFQLTDPNLKYLHNSLAPIRIF